MTYKTVYDAAHQSFPLFSFPAFGLVFVFIGGMLVWKGKLLQDIVSSKSIDPRSFARRRSLMAALATLPGLAQR
jgi:hypothetical protein